MATRNAIDVIARTGINVTRDGSDNLEFVSSANLEGIRIPVSIADSGPPNVKYDLREYLRDAKNRGLKVILLFDRDAFYWPDWRQNTDVYVKHWISFYDGLFDAIEIGNEWDHVSPNSWDIAPNDFSELLAAVRSACGPDIYLIAGGMAEGQPSIAQQVDFSPVNAWAFHPYLKDAPNDFDDEDVPDVDVLYAGYKDVIPADKSGIISEWGWPSQWGQPRQAMETSEIITWAARVGLPLYLYNLRDSGESFGILNNDYSTKQVYNSVKNTIATLPPIIEDKPTPPPLTPPATDLAPWRYWSAQQMADILGAPLANIEFLWPKLVEQMLHCDITSREAWAAMAGTVRIETGGPTPGLRFTCVREAYWMTEEWRAADLWYYPHYGRGPIQCTLKDNYDSYAQAIDDLWQAGGAIVSLVASNLDAMLDPDIGCAFAATYFRDHGGPGKYLIVKAAEARNWTEVRRLVQGGSAGLPDLIMYCNALLDIGAEQPPPSGVDYSKYRFPVVGYTGPINLHWGTEEGGTDIFAPRGTAVVAVSSGTVEYYAEWNALGGNAIQIKHDDDGLSSYYAHGNDEPNFKLGDHVNAGDLLFGLGDSGNATAAGPHLHIGIGYGINSGGGPTGGLGLNFDAVTFLRELQAYQQGSPSQPPAEPPIPCAELISTVGYLGGDIARRLDKELADMTIPPLEQKTSKRTKSYYQKRSELLEAIIHEMYKDGQAIKDEIIRAAAEALN